MLYLADNLATLEYKIQDEPMSVVHLLGTVINSCTHLASMLESGKVEGASEESIVGKHLTISGVSQAIQYRVTTAEQSVGGDCICGGRHQRFACSLHCLGHQESHLE